MNLPVILKSKTFWGTVLGSIAWLLGQPSVGLVEVAQAAGAVVTAAGVRDSISKAEQAK